MDTFSHFSDPHPLARQESPSQSDACSSTTVRGGPHSDEEVLLATNRPKRRAGRRIFKETRHPVYRGVRKRNGDKWVCELREPKKKSRIWLGTYPTPEMAARAHDVAALALKGKSACLNFADSARRLPVPASRDAREIRRAAGEAAELFRPGGFGGNDGDDPIRENNGSDDECKIYQENEVFVDEEAIFEMPKLLTDMAQGLLLSPPRFEWDVTTDWWNRLENEVDMPLWSY